MNPRTHVLTFLALTASAAAASAAEPSPACAPILKAMAMTLAADHSTVTVIDGRTTNGITAGGVNYLQIDGKWKVSGLSPKENQARSEENLRNATSYTCQALPDGSVDGVPVANYRTHTEGEFGAVDSTIAISKLSGLAIQVENAVEAVGKKQYTTRYRYTGIKAPSVQ